MPKPPRIQPTSYRYGRKKPKANSSGQHYDAHFVKEEDRREMLDWLSTIHPLWEDRYSKHHPPPVGKVQRALLRPVYWLGNWQFACLGYYHPPKGIKNRCVQAEPFPQILQKLVDKIEKLTRGMFHGNEIPSGWHLNTCLVNLYGDKLEGEKRIDTARVGEHKDFEPGPVASISLGERALFQFVSSVHEGTRNGVVSQQWLDDGSLQIFGGARWKSHFFHRVQRVDHKEGFRFSLAVEDFETRRVNLTFRYVPAEDVVRYKNLPSGSKQDVEGYMRTLAEHSSFFAKEIHALSGIQPSAQP